MEVKPTEQELIDLYENKTYPQITIKPWGKEIVLQANRYYAYKRIYINAGEKTSYQVHKWKTETNYIISGTAEIWEEDVNGVVIKSIRESDYCFHIPAGKKHRVIAITDVILQEVSLPYLSDCIRLLDDTNRGNGRIESEHVIPSVCILAAGKGTRMGEYSEHIHKSLLPLNNKAILSHLIEKFPKEYNIVIAVGYKKEQIKDYCKLVHNDRNIEFIEVDNYDKDGSGPGYSIKCCKKYLQKPFYILVSDCYLDEKIPNMFNNWLGYHNTDYPNLYSTFKLDGNNIIEFKNKDKNGYNNAFTGIAFINDYKIFWEQIENKNENDKEHELVSGFYNINKYSNFKGVMQQWYDVGTYDRYIDMKNKLESKNCNLFKNNIQFNYKTDKYFIKYFDKIDNLVKRGKVLEDVVPKIIENKTFLCYEWEKGQTLYHIDDIEIYMQFLEWYRKNVEIEKDINLDEECYNFYYVKTMKRLKEFEKQNDTDKYKIINNIEYESIHYYLNKVNFKELEKCLPTKFFHGDLQFDNIIYTEDNDFKYIDWRSDFGGNTEYGDVYYDLAKLYGGLIISYDKMRDSNNFKYHEEDNKITFSYEVDVKLDEFKNLYENWIFENGFNISKIVLLVAIIFLNMAPLHNNGFGKLIFCLSKNIFKLIT